ncbi:MAG: cytochrome c, class I [Proteobacteria bacterium]|nr:cytochrome c, class I [Pseudomonadota bacterium]
MKTSTLRITAAAAAALLAVSFAALAYAKTITLPPDGAQLKPSDLPGYALARKDCVVCHSAEYMLYQPPTAPRAYWEAMVKRMRDVFKAPVPEGDIAPIVDYLVKTYGNEQAK